VLSESCSRRVNFKLSKLSLELEKRKHFMLILLSNRKLFFWVCTNWHSYGSLLCMKSLNSCEEEKDENKPFLKILNESSYQTSI
jgi:hypothetical protein